MRALVSFCKKARIFDRVKFILLVHISSMQQYCATDDAISEGKNIYAIPNNCQTLYTCKHIYSLSSYLTVHGANFSYQRF